MSPDDAIESGRRSVDQVPIDSLGPVGANGSGPTAAGATSMRTGVMAPDAICSAKWHATCWLRQHLAQRGPLGVAARRPAGRGTACGTGSRCGGSAGEGRSPVSKMRSRASSTSGSGIGTADISAIVYGCNGSVVQVVGRRLLDDAARGT